MCRPASFIVTKKEVFWSKNTESHQGIISEFDLKEQDARGNYTLVGVEAIPPNQDYRLPFRKWEFVVDFAGHKRDLPAWWDEKKVEKRVRAKLKEWRKAKVIMPGETIEKFTAGQLVAVYGTLEYFEGGTLEYFKGGTLESFEGGTLKYFYGGTLESFEGGTLEYFYGGTLKYFEGGTLKYFEGGTLPKKITGRAVIMAYKSLSPDILASSQAVLIDRTQDPVVCHVGKNR
jgi:hypothetical protein